MGFIKRKLFEGAGGMYRFWIWPWIRAYKELKTHSIMRQRSYIPGTMLAGRNYIGKDAFIKNCNMGYGSYVQSGCDITDADIGCYTSIGSDVKTVIGSHPTEKKVTLHPAFYSKAEVPGFSYVEGTFATEHSARRTQIGSDVWIGNDVLIMGGVKIGDGAVVGAGAIVTKDLPPYSVNAGVPAKTMRYRFTEEQIEKLLADRWWEKDEAWIKANASRFTDVEEFLK